MRGKLGWKAWTGGIAVAFAASLCIFLVLLQTEKKALADYEKVTVYRAATAIPKGKVLEEANYAAYLESVELQVGTVPESALSSPEQITMLASKYDIEAGTILTVGMFEPVDEILEEMEEPVTAGFRAEDLYQVVGGVLRSGDRIHIYTVSETGEARLVWENIYVQQVFDGSGTQIESGDDASSAQRINVYLEADDVERFYSELAQGTLRVVKVCR